MITKAWASLASLLFLFLLIAQFIAYFEFSNIAQVVAISLGDILEHLDLANILLLVGIIVLTLLVDIIMPAKIAKWAILAPIFIPLMLRLGVPAQSVLAGYRLGDSPVNVMTPLTPYFPLMVVFAARYQKDAGIGTYAVPRSSSTNVVVPAIKGPTRRVDAVTRVVGGGVSL